MAEQVPLIWRTICEIFRDTDELRYKRIRARLKFLVADRGWEWVRSELERRLGFELDHDDTITGPRGALHTDHMGIGEQVDGNYYVGIPIERGRWTADQMLIRLLPDAAEPEWRDPSGTIRIDSMQAAPSWIGHLLTELEAATGGRVAYLTRLGAGHMPHPETVLQEGDLLHMVMREADTAKVAAVYSSGPAER